MSYRKIFNVQDIARSNDLWRESRTRINIALFATALLALLAVFAFL